MTDQEILDHIAKASQSICGRLSDDQMNKDIRITENKKRFSFVYLWNLLLATLLFARANAQVTPVKSKKPTVVKVPEMLMGVIAMEPEPVEAVIPVTAKGVVVDATNGKPVEGASIFIKAKSTGTVADSAGNFQLSIHKLQPMELVISAIGFETQTIVVDKSTGWQHIKVLMQPSATTLGEVEIVAWPTIRCGSRMGAVSIIKKVTITDTVKRTINNLIPAAIKKDVKVFPNPVIRGNNVQLSLALKQAGEYKLELMDAAGKVMMVQAIQMPDAVRNISIPTHAGWSAGVYWVRISGQHVKNVYQGKVLIK